MANIGSQLTNLPNLVTMGRVLFVPGVLYYMDNYSPVRSLVAAILYLVASLGDGIDGYLARKWKVESAFGRIVDPFADKILICGAFVFAIMGALVAACVDKAFGLQMISGAIGWAGRSMGSK